MAVSASSVQMSWAGALRGARDLAPLALFVTPFGMAFGVAAVERGMAPDHAAAMSALVYAGASQFAALEFWTSPMAYPPLLMVVFAVNARHILLGAALYPWMRDLPPLQRYGAALMMNDASWAYSLERSAAGERDVGVLVGGGAVMWLCWVLATIAGAGLVGQGGFDARALALDTVMAAFFATALVGMARRDRVARWGPPWAVAAIAALAAAEWAPTGWHVPIGAVAGGAVGALLYRPEPQPEESAS